MSVFVRMMNKLSKQLVNYQHNCSAEVGSSTIYYNNQSINIFNLFDSWSDFSVFYKRINFLEFKKRF